jgi:hypothetical protein
MTDSPNTTFYEAVKFDDFVKSHEIDGTVKSSRCKAHELACWQAGL